MHGYLQRKAYLTFMPYFKTFFPKGFEMERAQTGFNSTTAQLKTLPRPAPGGTGNSEIVAVLTLEQRKSV